MNFFSKLKDYATHKAILSELMSKFRDWYFTLDLRIMGLGIDYLMVQCSLHSTILNMKVVGLKYV